MQQSAVGSSLKQIRAGVCFAMIGDESEDIQQRSDRMSTLAKQEFFFINIDILDIDMFLWRTEILEDMSDQTTTTCAKVVAACLASQTLILGKRDYKL